jgi:predicted permease
VLTTLLRLLPVIVGMVTGYVLVRAAVATQADGEFVFKIVFYVCMPALIFTSVSRTTLSGPFVVFLLAAPAFMTLGYLTSRVVARRAGFTGIQPPVV